MRRCFALFQFFALASAEDASLWPDCSVEEVHSDGLFKGFNQFNVTQNDTHIFVSHPELSILPLPVMVFSHGSTGEYAMYEAAIRRYVSHGFVVIFPYIKDAQKDTSPFTLDPMGGFTMKGFYYAHFANGDANSPLHEKLDLGNVALVGHSMGATSTLMAAAKLPEGSVKVAVSQHPGICGPYGPPPCLPGSCNTWMPHDLETVSQRIPFLLTTATNDGAFWPAPYTAEHELGCFNSPFQHPEAKNATAFAQFSQSACEDDGKGGRYDRKWSNGGHDCPMKSQSPETPWVLTAVKLYTQLGGSASSKCHSMLWGSEADSLQKDSNIDKSVVHTPADIQDYLLV